MTSISFELTHLLKCSFGGWPALLIWQAKKKTPAPRSLAFDEPFVLVVRANPEPEKIIASAPGQGAIAAAHTHRPESARGFEVKGRVIGVCLK